LGYGLLASGATPAANWSSSPITAAADGSATVPVSFDTPFSGGSPSVVLTATAAADDGTELDIRAIGITATGFSIAAHGGPPGSTVQVNYIALGVS